MRTEADIKLARVIDAAVQEHIRTCGESPPAAFAGAAAELMHRFAMINFVQGVPVQEACALGNLCVKQFYEHNAEAGPILKALRDALEGLKKGVPDGPTH
jgi:hypothetical protein